MRSIPMALQAKLLEHMQVQAKDAQPSLRLVCTQASVNTLLTESIHEGIPAGYGDVALRQLPGERSPSLCYAICIDNGVAKVYERRFPTTLEEPWSYLWTLGTAQEVALEFDGDWVLERQKRWYVLQTEQVPYLFLVAGGTLSVQHWTEESARVPLDTGVSCISACKGWRSTLLPHLDQGLLVGYLKGGKVFYRALCRQEDGTLLWEPPYEVTELGTGNESLCVFRTNDFRIGFVTEQAGRMKWALSHRDYAGMSVRPETVEAQAREVRVTLQPLQSRNAVCSERITASGGNVFALLYPPAAATLAITKVEKLSADERNANGFKLFLSLPIALLPKDYAGSITTNPARTVTAVSYSESEQALVFTVSPVVSRSIDVAITLAENREGSYTKYGTQLHPLEALTCTAAKEVVNRYGITNETILAGVQGLSISLPAVVLNKGTHAQSMTASVTAVTVSLAAVSQLPI